MTDAVAEQAAFSRKCAIIAAQAADEKKATDIMVQEVRELIGVTDYFVILPARSGVSRIVARHLQVASRLPPGRTGCHLLAAPRQPRGSRQGIGAGHAAETEARKGVCATTSPRFGRTAPDFAPKRKEAGSSSPPAPLARQSRL